MTPEQKQHVEGIIAFKVKQIFPNGNPPPLSKDLITKTTMKEYEEIFAPSHNKYKAQRALPTIPYQMSRYKMQIEKTGGEALFLTDGDKDIELSPGSEKYKDAQTFFDYEKKMGFLNSNTRNYNLNPGIRIESMAISKCDFEKYLIARSWEVPVSKLGKNFSNAMLLSNKIEINDVFRKCFEVGYPELEVGGNNIAHFKTSNGKSIHLNAFLKIEEGGGRNLTINDDCCLGSVDIRSAGTIDIVNNIIKCTSIGFIKEDDAKSKFDNPRAYSNFKYIKKKHLLAVLNIA